MTIAVVKDGQVINVGPWDEMASEVFVLNDEIPADALIVDGFWVQNPLPAGAETLDVALAWTVDGRIVLASNPAAHSPYL